MCVCLQLLVAAATTTTKAGLFGDEFGSYVTLCCYVTLLVSTWCQLLIRPTIPSPQIYAADLNTEMAARGIAVLNIGLWFEMVVVIFRLHIFARRTQRESTYISEREPLRIMIAFTLEGKSNGYFALFLTEVYNGAMWSQRIAPL